MAKKNKPTRIAPRLPRGFVDREPADIRAVNAMIATITSVYERYGFDPVETPLIEYTEALGKFLPDSDRPNEGVFSLQDDDESWLSLRYDLTAPLARHFAENFDRLPKPYRTYRAGYVFRNEKPGPGRFRQFMQLDADTVGSASPAADAEMCMMMADCLDALGLEGKYVIKVNNRKVLDGVMEDAGVTDEGQKLAVMRAIDKLDKFGIEGVRQLLGEGRKDESGDFTKGAGLDGFAVGRIETYLVSAGSQRNVANQVAIAEQSEVGEAGLNELEVMAQMFIASNYGTEKIRIDPSVVRGLEYYTGTVFEAELTFPVTNEKGQEVVFGAVGGGGRYDGLVSRFRAEPVPATGFSIGVSRLAHALKLTGNLNANAAADLVVVLVMDPERTADYQQMTAELRRSGVRAEMFLGNTKNFGKQVAYADKRNAAAVIIEGSQERDEGIVQIKDLVEGKRAAAAIADNAEWKSERPGQFAVKRADLVAEVKKLFAEQGKG